MAFSPEPQPTDDPPYSEDATIWAASDGIAGIIDATEFLGGAVKALRQERDDALAAATHYGAEVELVRRALEQERAAHIACQAELTEAVESRAAYREEARIAIAKNKAAAQVFGGALASVDHFTNVKGPNRPNRRKLSDWEAGQVRDYARRTGSTVKAIAERWGVHSSTISRILNGKAY